MPAAKKLRTKVSTTHQPSLLLTFPSDFASLIKSTANNGVLDYCALVLDVRSNGNVYE